jgi:phenylacetate-CoA ligase
MYRAFGVRPRQHYGMAEAVANASECELGRLHVDEDFAYTEFLPGETGEGLRVVGTNLSNPATPLLRYEVQDRVTLASGKCPCGRPGRILERVDGRHEDYIVLADGRRLGRLDHIFKDLVRIREAQIVQHRAGEVRFRIVRREGYAEADEKLLLAEAQQRMGGETRIEIEYADRLERSAAGKLRFVVSHLENGRLDTAGRA